eukprot:9717804-Alexandrium_andersonii.AAC.1
MAVAVQGLAGRVVAPEGLNEPLIGLIQLVLGCARSLYGCEGCSGVAAAPFLRILLVTGPQVVKIPAAA